MRRAHIPRFWVASQAAARLIAKLSDRLRRVSSSADLQRLGDLLAYPALRGRVAGQQTLIAATSALSAHYATGQLESADAHLGVLLAWCDPSAGVPLAKAIASAERFPIGVSTDPVEDRKLLAPRIAKYNAARIAGASATVLDARRVAIADVLRPYANRTIDATQRSLAMLAGSGLDPLPALEALEQREAAEFSAYMAMLDAGLRVGLRDSPKAATFGLALREEAEETVECALRIQDRVAYARAVLAGDIVEGTVADPRRVRIGARRFDLAFTLITSQEQMRPRPGDELVRIDDPRLRFAIKALRRSAGAITLELLVVRGKRSPGLPAAGAQLALAAKVDDWQRLPRLRGLLKARLAVTPWTHRPGSLPAPVPATIPTPFDPLAALEAVR